MRRRNQHVRREWLPSNFKIMLSETVVVVGWAALIPGLMWLGGAAGF